MLQEDAMLGKRAYSLLWSLRKFYVFLVIIESTVVNKKGVEPPVFYRDKPVELETWEKTVIWIVLILMAFSKQVSEFFEQKFFLTVFLREFLA